MSESDDEEVRARARGFQWHSMMAGGIAGAATRFVCQPFDVLKIRFQVQIEPLDHSFQGSKYKSLFQACQLIFREEGVRGFWKGHNPAQILSIGYGITQFTVYEQLHGAALVHWGLLGSNHPQLLNFVCGGLAGGAASIVATPLDVIRTRLIVQDHKRGYRNTLEATRSILREDGFRGLYRGFVPSLWQIIPLAGLNFLFYNFYCGQLQRLLNIQRREHLPIWGSLSMGALTGVSARTLVYPLDVIKKRLQIQGFDRHHQTYGQHFTCDGMMNCIGATLRREGFIGLYKGMGPSILKGMVTTALHFCIYDEMKKVLMKI